ncbi:MAG: prepilin-type N-terminal cleavage/methylation domain-containing protein [Desulfobacteria bacterium]
MLSVRKNEPGFTLIEIMIALAIAGILLVSIYNLYISQSRTYTVQEQVSEMQQNARVAMNIISRDIRMAGFNPTGATFNGLTYGTSQIQIKADLNGNGTISGADEDITYALNTADSNHPKITRNSQPFAEDIETLGFTPSGTNGATISITARTRNKDPKHTGDGYHRMTLTAVVVARNL